MENISKETYSKLLNSYTDLKLYNKDLKISIDDYTQMCFDKQFAINLAPREIDLGLYTAIRVDDLNDKELIEFLKRKIDLTKKEVFEKRWEKIGLIESQELFDVPTSLGDYTYKLITKTRKIISLYRYFRKKGLGIFERVVQVVHAPLTPIPEFAEDDMLVGRILMSYIVLHPEIFGIVSCEFRRALVMMMDSNSNCVSLVSRTSHKSMEWYNLFNSFNPRIYIDKFNIEAKFWTDESRKHGVEVRVYHVEDIRKIFSTWSNLLNLCEDVLEKENKLTQ